MSETTGLHEVLNDVKDQIRVHIRAEERSRKAKKAFHVVAVGLSAVLLLSIVLYFSHYHLLLAARGFSSSPDCILYSTIDENGEEHRVVGDRSGQIPQALAYLRKNAFGIWTVVETRRIDANNHLISMGIAADTISNNASDSPVLASFYQHQEVLIGDTAIKGIPDLSANMSENYVFEVNQTGNQYIIRLTWSGKGDALSELSSLMEWLMSAGYIQTSYPTMVLK